jgi:hypothetical protein
VCPGFLGNAGPAITDREDDPRMAKSHIQLYPPVFFSIHEFVICVLKKVKEYLANLGFAATDNGRRDQRRNDQTNIVCPEPLRT